MDPAVKTSQFEVGKNPLTVYYSWKSVAVNSDLQEQREQVGQVHME